MTTELNLIAALSQNLAEPLTVRKKRCSARSPKLLRWGAHVGVNADQMILSLESDLTVGELQEYLAARSGEVA